MRNHLLTLAVAVALLAGALAASPARAEQDLTEVDGFPFSLALQAGLRAQSLPVSDPAGYSAAALFPHTVASVDVLAITRGKGAAPLKLVMGHTGGQFGGPQAPAKTLFAFTAGDDTKAQLIGGPGAFYNGVVNRICVWSNGSGGDLIVLFTMADGSNADGPVYGIAFSASGAPRPVDTAGARAYFGGFDVTDLNGDGRYELITARNLDGLEGGFTYHAIRAYSGTGYAPQPDGFKDYFKGELDFLNWVVATRDAIQANPQPYLSDKLAGYAYVADYKKQSYGFDTLIELPESAGGKFDVAKYNQLRHGAYERVKRYRDELQAWLGGGPHPATWQLRQ
jgi:hypothetical protein